MVIVLEHWTAQRVACSIATGCLGVLAQKMQKKESYTDIKQETIYEIRILGQNEQNDSDSRDAMALN